MTSQPETATSFASSVLGSEAVQSVATELVIFCATIVVAILLKVAKFSGCAASFHNLWPATQRAAPGKPRPTWLATRNAGNGRQQFAAKEMPPPSSDSSAAVPSVAQTGGSRRAGARAVPGFAQTVDTIMDLANDKRAVEALSLYSKIRADQTTLNLMQAQLRSARRSGLDFYSVLVQSAVRSGQPEMVEQLLDDMTSAHLERTLSFYESVMKVLAGKKHYRQALAVYNRLSSEGFTASPVTLSCLINFTAELGDLDSAIKFFEQLEATSKPSVRAYMVALRVYSKRQDLTKSLEILCSMKAREVPVDSLILNTVLATGVAAGKTEASEELLHEMSKTDPGITDVISYNTVLKGYAHQKIGDKALKMLELMLAREIKPNGITFNTVMDAAVRGSQIEEAWKTLDLMQKAGLRPDKYTCTILMKALHENSTPKQLSRLIEIIESVLPQCDTALSGSLFRGVIQVAARLNNTALLMNAFKGMQSHHVPPTTADYQLVIQTLAQQCDTAHCSSIWRYALACGTNGGGQQQPTTATVVTIFSSVMDELAKSLQVEGMICAFESLVAVVPAGEGNKPRAGPPGSQKSFENRVPQIVQQCRAALLQAASRKQHASPAFRRLLELAPEQGLPLETLMKC